MTGAAMTFEGFPTAGLDFLTELGGQDKEWFTENRTIYDRDVVAPTKAFVTALGDELNARVSPQIIAQPKANGSIAPINNDLRFSPDKSPYKDHLLLKFWEGDNKKTAPTLYVRISAADVGFATGAMLTDLDRWRELIDDAVGGGLADALAELGKGRSLDIAGEGYKRVPKPFDEDHPRAALLRHKGLQARWAEPTPKTISSPDFVDYCADRLDACTPVHQWLVANL